MDPPTMGHKIALPYQSTLIDISKGNLLFITFFFYGLGLNLAYFLLSTCYLNITDVVKQ